jgi:mannitol-1-/sugar-/sorbitol-6-phosphatase
VEGDISQGCPGVYALRVTPSAVPSSAPTPPDLLAPLAGRRFAAVLFDMDGTLIDSTPVVVRSWVTWALERGIAPERLEGHHGVPAAQIVRGLVPESDVEAAIARINALEIADVEGITMLPGAAEAVAALPEARRAIVTSCTRPLATARIAATGLRAPSVVVTADDVTTGKPDPAPYLLGARRLGVDPADCLVVEDAPSGLLAARAAGAATLAVTTTTPADRLDADAVVGTLADVRFAADADGVRVLAA